MGGGYDLVDLKENVPLIGGHVGIRVKNAFFP